jgi:hypothetical protein
MTRSIGRVLLCSMIVFCATSLCAQDDDDKPKDAEGCKDSPLITAFPAASSTPATTKSTSKPIFRWAATR